MCTVRRGHFETTRAALPLMQRAAGGRIVNLSSGAGIIGMGGQRDQFAVEGLSEALAQEVAPLGIRVIIVEPGTFRTEFLGRSNAVAKQQIEAYSATGGAARAYRGDNDGRQPGDPSQGRSGDDEGDRRRGTTTAPAAWPPGL